MFFYKAFANTLFSTWQIYYSHLLTSHCSFILFVLKVVTVQFWGKIDIFCFLFLFCFFAQKNIWVFWCSSKLWFTFVLIVYLNAVPLTVIISCYYLNPFSTLLRGSYSVNQGDLGEIKQCWWNNWYKLWTILAGERLDSFWFYTLVVGHVFSLCLVCFAQQTVFILAH